MSKIKLTAILLVAPLIYAFSSLIYCENTTFCSKFGPNLTSIFSFIFYFIVVLITYFLFKLLNAGVYKIFSKNMKGYQLALIISLIFIFFAISTSDFPVTKAYLTKNVNFCKELKSSATECQCALMIAKLESDESICEILTGDIERNYCLSKFRESMKLSQITVKNEAATSTPATSTEETGIAICAGEGERVRASGAGFPRDCCPGLKAMYGYAQLNCIVPGLPGDIGTCSDCGNGTCEPQYSENKCNCPQDCENETADWQTYRNEEYEFEFNISPFFIEIGYEISEKEYPCHYFEDEKCNYFFFETYPVAPYYESVDDNKLETLISLAFCPIEYCQTDSGKQMCAALRAGQNELPNGDWLFTNYIAENDRYIVYLSSGESTGDVASAMGWEKDEVQEAKNLMLSTFKFLE